MSKRHLSMMRCNYFNYMINGYERCILNFAKSMRTIGTEEGDTIHIVSGKYYMTPSISDIGLIFNKATIYNRSNNVRKTIRYYSYKYKDIAKMSQFKGR